MSAGSIPAELRTYLPSSLFQADGTTLKPGVDADKAIEVAQGIQAKADAMPPAEAAIFLAMVDAADLAPGGQIPADIEGAIEAFATAASLVSTLAISSNALDFLARVMIEQAGEQRKSALQDRLSAREIAKGELLNQAGKMDEEADKLSSSAKTAMIVSVVMSSIAVVGAVAGAFASGFSAVKQAGALKSALAGGESMATVGSNLGAMAGKASSIASSVGGAASSVAQSSNQIGQGLSGYYSTMGQADAKHLEAEGQRSAAEAQETQAEGDIAKEQQQALDQMVQSIIQFLKDLKEAKAQQMQVLTRV